MPRSYSLSYLTAHRCTPPQALQMAAELGFRTLGLRLWQNVPGSPWQPLIEQPALLRETLAAQRDTGVGVLDLEIIRIGPGFTDASAWDALYDIGAALGAQCIVVAGDDPDEARLAQNFAAVCERLRPRGLRAELEFMPFTAVPDLRAALRVLHAAGLPDNGGVLVDALHVGRSATTLDEVRAIPRRLLHFAQICDGAAGTHFSTDEMVHTARCARLPPGEGTIDLHGLFAALPADLPVSVEVVHHERESQMTPAAWAALCLAASRPFADTP